MFIPIKKLLSLPVFTESGVRLGTVSDIEIDVDSHQIRRYEVSAGIFSKSRYLISPAQVKSITVEKMTVDDCALKEKKTAMEKMAPAPSLGNVATRSEE